MIRDNDLRRLDDLARQVSDRCSEDFRRAVDALAGRIVTLGLLKATLTCETGDKPSDSIRASGILARWLGDCFPALSQVAKLVETDKKNAKKSWTDDEWKIYCRSLVEDLLTVEDVALWRGIDDEALGYMAQFKLYAKSVVEPDKKKQRAVKIGEG